MSAPPWWSVHPPVQIVVECSNEKHEIRWAEGYLHVPHHSDPAGERVLASLGGERLRCIELLDAWENQKDDLRVLTLASRGPGDLVRTMAGRVQISQRPSFGPVSHNVVSHTMTLGTPAGRWGGRAPVSARQHLAMSTRYGDNIKQDQAESLLSLGNALPDRLVATVLATWCDRVESSDLGTQRAQLTAALFGRATLALRNWLGDPNLTVDIDMIGKSESPAITRTGDVIVARLPFRWLLDIWTRSLTVVLGRFSLSLVNESDRRQRVMTIGTDLVDIRPVTISLGDG